ncbi:MAG TPA: zinc ribbon domain-containing protein [bacterium]|nr:zinc ribbon domain-containing protein [bacterium]
MAVNSAICPKCGEQNEPDARFCGSCGAPLEQAPSPDRPAGAPVEATPATPVLSEQSATPSRPRWLLPVGGVVAAFALAAAVVFSGVLSPKNPTPPQSHTGQSPVPAPITRTIPAPVPRPVLAVDRFTVTSVSPTSVKGGLRVALAGTLVLSGAADGATVQVFPAWRVGGPQTPLHYGSPASVKAKDGTVPLSGTASVSLQGVSQTDSILMYLVARIGGREWVSTPSPVALALIPSAPQQATVPVPPVPRPRPAPPTPVAPAPPPAPAAPSIQSVRLSSTSSIRVRAGDPVSFDLAFNLVGQQRAMLRVVTALKKADGGWNYQTASSFEAVEGPNVVHGLHFASSTGAGPFTTFPVYGLVQLNGKTYESGQPVVVSILPGSGTTASGGVVTPPAPTPAPSGQAKPSNSCLKIVNQRSVVTTVAVVGYNESVSFWDFTAGETGVLVTGGEPLHGSNFTIRLYDGKGIDASRQLEGNNKHVFWRFDPSVTDNGKCPSGAWVGTLHD